MNNNNSPRLKFINLMVVEVKKMRYLWGVNTLELHITYLLTKHQCVIVPGWGAFVSNYEPAKIDLDRGVIMPPMRVLGFNPSIGHNDGLLATSISSAKGMSFNEATALIALHVKAMRSQLEQAGQLRFKNLGVFTYQPGAAPEFTAAASPLLSPAHFGLRPVSVRPLSEVAATKPDVAHELSPKPHRFGRVLKTVGRVAASVALLIGLGVLLSTPVLVENQADRANVNPITKVTAPKPVKVTGEDKAVEPFKAPETSVEKAAEVTPAKVNETTPKKVAEATPAKAKTVADKPVKVAEPAAPKVRRMDESDPYCLIVASLTTRDEAEQYLSRAADKTLKILEKDGKYRIYAATGQTSAQAQSHLSNGSLGRSYPGAWVCHR